MPTSSDLLDKLISLCKKEPVTSDNLVACCSEILSQYQFDTVFIASAPTPEAELMPLVMAGNQDVVDTCLYRLGVEEKVALAKLPLKSYTDMTGKPMFNQYGSLKMQKPKSAIFLVYNIPGKDYLLLGCGHLESKTYAPALVQEMSQLWTMWKELLAGTAEKARRPKAPPPSAPVPAPSLGVASAGEAPPVTEGLPHRSTHLVDEVTRLYNNNYFEENLKVEVERAKRYTRNMCLLMLAVGKTDPTGTPPDNQVAIHIAEVLLKSLRRVDIICRVEKDRYAIILPDTATNTCGVIAKRIFKFFKQELGGMPSVYINLSASSFPESSTESGGLNEKAMALLQQAREAGHNKAVLTD